MRKFIDKFGEELVGILAKAVAAALLGVLTVVVAVVSGRTDIAAWAGVVGITIAAFLIGQFLGKRPYAERTRHMEKAFSRGNLLVIGAFYGAKDRWVDVTDTVNTHIRNGDYPFAATYINLTGGKDPYPYEPKQLICVYKQKWGIATLSFLEGYMVDLPPPHQQQP